MVAPEDNSYPDKGEYQPLRLKDLTDDDVTKKKNFRPLPQDMWGVTILVAVGDIPQVCSGKADCHTLVRLIFSFAAVCINLWLQIVILYYVNEYIVGQAVHETQANYAQFHKEVFDDDGSFDEKKWHVWTGPYMALCNMAVSKFHFTLAIIFIWTTRMLGEFRSVERLHRDIHSCSALPEDAEVSNMLHAKGIDNEGQHEEYHIIALSRCARLIIYVFVILPKLIIVSALMFIGCQWMAATESFSDLILNALALVFIIEVDELVYANFTPLRMQEYLDKTKILHVKALGNTQETGPEVIWVYVKSIIFMGIAFTWSWVYLNYFQQVIPYFTHDIQAHCGGWFTAYYERTCPNFGDPEKCFPFGD